jgi:hypothetical protein
VSESEWLLFDRADSAVVTGGICERREVEGKEREEGNSERMQMGRTAAALDALRWHRPDDIRWDGSRALSIILSSHYVYIPAILSLSLQKSTFTLFSSSPTLLCSRSSMFSHHPHHFYTSSTAAEGKGERMQAKYQTHETFKVGAD